MSTDMQYVYDVYDGMCLNRHGRLRVLTLQEVLTVLVAICPPLGKIATRFRLNPHMPAMSGCCGERYRWTKMLSTISYKSQQK